MVRSDRTRNRTSRHRSVVATCSTGSAVLPFLDSSRRRSPATRPKTAARTDEKPLSATCLHLLRGRTAWPFLVIHIRDGVEDYFDERTSASWNGLTFHRLMVISPAESNPSFA